MAKEKVTVPSSSAPFVDPGTGQVNEVWLRFLADMARKINALNESP